MSLVRSIFLSAGALALAACGGNPSTTEPATEEGSGGGGQQILADQAIPPETVNASDTLGQFEGSVSAVAMWQHPTVSFRSAVLAANGSAGLYVIPIDGSGQSTSVEGDFSGGVAVGYTGDDAIAAAYDAAIGGVRVFAIDPSSRELSQITLGTTSDGAKALCFVGTTLVRIANDGAVYRHQLSIEETGVVLNVTSVPRVAATACAGGRDFVYLLSENGRVLPMSAEGMVGESLASPRGTVALAAFPTANDTKLVFAQENGTVSLGDKVMLVADTAGPLALRSLAAGSGNFGGTYRSGILGYVSSENDLGLVSWLALTNAADIDAPSVSIQSENAGVSADIIGERIDRGNGEVPDLTPMEEEKLDGFRAPPGGGN